MSTPLFEGFLLRACEDDSLSINCPGEIYIISANYGRLTGGHLCPGQKTSNTNCGAAGSLDIVRGECQGKQECTLEASNEVFGDPCVSIRKYLEVSIIQSKKKIVSFCFLLFLLENWYLK